MKWAYYENKYTVADHVADELPLGVYDCNSSWGRAILERLNVEEDELYILPRSDAAQILGEVENFWAKKEVFNKYGIVHKRGILLHGGPGTGKTSILHMIKELADRNNAVCLKLADDVNDFLLCLKTVRNATDRPIVVFSEDIDRHSDNELLLDILDGAHSITNMVFVATTNYIEKLPSRLTNRPSRFDLCIEIKPPNLKTREAFFKALSSQDEDPTKEDAYWEDWANRTEGLTFAHLKELFISVEILGKDFETSLGAVKEMSDDAYNEETDEQDAPVQSV